MSQQAVADYKSIEADRSILEYALAPYKSGCKYLKSATMEVSGNEGEPGWTVAARGKFSIPESFYIEDTGHFNAVEFNICFNQLFYFLVAACIHRRLLNSLSHWTIEDFERLQLPNYLIMTLSSRFRKQMQSNHFEGVLAVKKTMKRKGRIFIKTTCSFSDGQGENDGEVLIGILDLT